MVDARQLISFKRFVDTQQETIKIFSSEQPEQIHISISNGRVSKIETKTAIELKNTQSIGFFAIYGLIALKQWSYLMLVTKANMVGQILQRNIFQIEEVQFLPMCQNARVNDVHPEDQKIVDMLQSVFKTKALYFSYEYDLSNSFDKVMANSSQFGSQPKTSEGLNYYKIPNNRFAYNWEHIKFLNQFQSTNQLVLQYWQTIVISGVFMIRYCQLNQSSDCTFILISRREILRAGRRFTQRGCDDDGNCTNFAETEQILILNKQDNLDVYSFVQTRGSMPFAWKQPPTLKWSPKAVILADRNYNQDLCKKHFEQQMQKYPQQILLNLIDKKGTQKMLGEYFTQMVSGLKQMQIKYVWFDFHHECRKMKYENLSKLLNDIKDDLKKAGYFHCIINKQNVNQINNIISSQNGVVRTNCMDCLDRTNVVQGAVGRNILLNILNKAGIIHTLTGEAFQVLPNDLERIFRDFWTKNADVMSCLYSGTGALKTDFTRTGKRTTMGALQDGRNSLHRYYLNNFVDAYNQNCVDLALGKLDAQQVNYKRPLLNGAILVLIFIFIVLTFCVKVIPSLIFSDDSYFGQSWLLSIIIFTLSCLFTSKVLLKTHSVFIEKPLRDQN